MNRAVDGYTEKSESRISGSRWQDQRFASRPEQYPAAQRVAKRAGESVLRHGKPIAKEMAKNIRARESDIFPR